MIYILSFIVLLSIVVVVHEFGHFSMARLCGVKVEEFSLGFGKELFVWVDKKGTKWKVCLIPFGGYVKMYGDADPASMGVSEETAKMSEEDKKMSFYHKRIWQKMLIVVMGPGMNYIFAILVLTSVLAIFGQVKIPPIVDGVTENSPAQQAGIMEGDEIVSINGKEIESFTDLKRIVIVDGYEKSLDFVIKRNDKELDFKITPELETGMPVIGVLGGSKSYYDDKLSLWQAFTSACNFAYTSTVDTISYVGQLITASRPADDLMGPIGIAQASGNAMQQGGLNFVLFIAQVSIGIGLINLFPIPMLDGGHLVIYMVEAITRRPISPMMQNILGYIGVGFLICLMILTFKNDIFKLFGF